MHSQESQSAVAESGSASFGCPVAHVEYEGPFRAAGTSYAMWDELREAGPIHYYESELPRYLVVGHDEVRQVLQDAETFPQSKHLLVLEDGESPFSLIPEDLNGDEHQKWRRLLAPYWSPAVANQWEPRIRACVIEHIERVKPDGRCEFIGEFATRVAPALFLEFMGLPLEDMDMLLEWNFNVMHPDFASPEVAMRKVGQAASGVTEYYREIIERRRGMPVEQRPEGLLSTALTWQLDGKPIPDEDLLAFFNVMFTAGLDTVAAGMSYGFLHLAAHPRDRQQIVDDPSIIPNATEELLRAYPFVNLMRDVAVDTVVGGCPLKVGDVLVLSTPSAGRDENTYPAGTEVDFGRKRMPHPAFGDGPHHCLGSNFARKELRVVYEEWHKRIPNYRLDDDFEVIETSGQMQALVSMHLRWDA